MGIESPDNQRRRRQVEQSVAACLPTLVMLLVVVMHLVETHRSSLTRWKGGGFGMFSTTDSATNRSVKVYLDTEKNGSLLATVPRDLRRSVRKVRYRPVEDDIDRLMRQLSDRNWMMVDKRALVAPIETDSVDTVPLIVRRIRVEVLTPSYEPSQRTVETRRLVSAELEKPRKREGPRP